MKIRAVALLVICLVLVPSLGMADAFPKSRSLIAAGQVINATASVTYGPFTFSDMGVSTTGNFALEMKFVSATGDADVKVEVLAYSDIDDGGVIFYDTALSVASTLIASTYTSLNAAGTHEDVIIMPLQLPVTSKFYLKITGVGSNPADTVPLAYLHHH